MTTTFVSLLLCLIQLVKLISISTADDLFLLSGQSNMDGYTTWGQSLTGNADYWISMKSILATGGPEMEEELYNVIYEANINKGGHEVANTLTNELMHMYNQGLLDELDSPLKVGKCSFVTHKKKTGTLKHMSNGTVPTIWDANCGYSFGHELMFSRTLELQMAMNETTFEMVKNSRGGTSLYKHWYPEIGEFWPSLKQTIHSRSGPGNNWQGLIWHQGTQEAWSEKKLGEDRSLTYLGNLTELISQLRQEMYAASEVGTWQCFEEIPVVVVQLGFWPKRSEAAQRVRDAQAEYCSNDPKATLVKSDDLSRNFHYDAASFLVTGNRIAYAYQEALRGEVACPDDTTLQPSAMPSMLVSSIVTPSIHPAGDRTTSKEPASQTDGEMKRITTIFDGTYRDVGFMFDIYTKKDISIRGMELNLYGNHSDSEYEMEIYTKIGSFTESENDKDAWQLWYNNTVTGAGLDSPTCVGLCLEGDDVNDELSPLECGANKTRAFYVSLQEAVLVYTDGNENNTASFENDDIEIHEGGVKRNGWSGKVLPGLFNGAFTYTTRITDEFI